MKILQAQWTQKFSTAVGPQTTVLSLDFSKTQCSMTIENYFGNKM
jgi:hypothetical protein